MAEQRGDRFFITQPGLDWLGGDYEQLPTGIELQRYWLAKLSGGQREIFRAVVENPAGISRDDISEKTGLKRSTRDRYLQHLQAQELVTSEGSSILPSETLFE
jgi:CRP-like cAMP-binding protein